MAMWMVYDPNEGDESDAVEVEAWDAEDAAQFYAEDADVKSGEGWSERREVWVRKAGDAVWVKVVVYGEATVTYSAHMTSVNGDE